MGKATANPFSAVTDDQGEIDPETIDVEGMGKLGEAASAALDEYADGTAEQEPLDGTDYLKVKFLGMSMDSLEDDIPLGQELTFLVRARCIGEGTDISKQDGHKKRFRKMDVQSVKIFND
ncbi:hypothetical protein SEA_BEATUSCOMEDENTI_78 [Arthrobacter phage BeatusComedenti]|uniref:Uncharacterized protein n=1 Tax=Arthrobacter phage BeatusComedenti TaxID=2656523 RepID=A0A649VVF3_9CAUD|nr:hypothetical protein SEA_BEATUSCOMEDENTI_78 [Arthrobacter phage BeatusComedenti]